VLDFSASPVPYLTPVALMETAKVFTPVVRDFQLIVVSGDCSTSIPSAAILLCTAGEFTVEGGRGSVALARGGSVFATADESTLKIRGSGQLFVATTQ
jgi:mannose-6-phosphate isomerase